MAANSFQHTSVRLIGLLAILLGLWFGAGCAEGDMASPSSSQTHISINAGPDKPMTQIQISLESPMLISLDILDANGGQVVPLYHGFRDAGQSSFVWNGTDEEGVVVASGPYWAVLSSAAGIEATAMMMIK